MIMFHGFNLFVIMFGGVGILFGLTDFYGWLWRQVAEAGYVKEAEKYVTPNYLQNLGALFLFFSILFGAYDF